MPQMTAKYPFEWKIFKWASHFSHRMAGENRGFVIILCEGRVREIHFGEQMERLPPNAEAIRAAHESWLVYDPFEGPVYTYIEWKNAPQSAVERLIGAAFEPGDFFCATPDAGASRGSPRRGASCSERRSGFTGSRAARSYRDPLARPPFALYNYRRTGKEY